jgi:hypothetical protein
MNHSFVNNDRLKLNNHDPRYWLTRWRLVERRTRPREKDERVELLKSDLLFLPLRLKKLLVIKVISLNSYVRRKRRRRRESSFRGENDANTFLLKPLFLLRSGALRELESLSVGHGERRDGMRE